MLIAIDIGNSSINIGFFTETALFVKKIDTYPILSASQYYSFFNSFIKETNINKKPEGIIISSVVPRTTEVLEKALKKFVPIEPLRVNWKIKTGLTFKIPKPAVLGSDRIANAVAAYALSRSPVATVDFGTATTISVVGEKASFIGGAIFPGIRLMIESLDRGTSQLFEIMIKSPASALGTDTAESIESGIWYGSAGAVEKILEEIEKKIGYRLKVVITGGFGWIVSSFIKRQHLVVPHLTLEGLNLIYEMNSYA